VNFTAAVWSTKRSRTYIKRERRERRERRGERHIGTREMVGDRETLEGASRSISCDGVCEPQNEDGIVAAAPVQLRGDTWPCDHLVDRYEALLASQKSAKKCNSLSLVPSFQMPLLLFLSLTLSPCLSLLVCRLGPPGPA